MRLDSSLVIRNGLNDRGGRHPWQELTDRPCEPTVGAERQTVDLGLVADDHQLDAAESHEVVPLPPAQVLRTVREQSRGAAEVVRNQRVMSQGDAVEVRISEATC